MALTQISDAGLQKPASDLQDNEKIILGTGNDLEIYHDGNHSIIKDAGTGAIKVIGDDVRFENASGNNLVKANGNVAELFHTGNKKLETTSSGVDVTGTLECDQISILAVNPFQSSTNVFQGTGTNGARLRSALSDQATPSFSNQADTDTGMFLPGSNVIGFTTGGVEKLRIDSTGRISSGKHGVGTYNDAAEWFKVQSNDTAANISIVASNDTHSSLNLGDEDDFNIQKIRSDHTNNSLEFFTNNTERLRIDSSGNIGAGGITSPLWTTGGGIHLNDNYGIGFGNGGSGRPDFQIATTGGASLDLRCGFGADTADIIIDTSGYVGIGATPAQPLHVKGLCRFETTNSTNHWINYAHTDDSYRFNYNGSGSDEITFPSGGGMTFTGATFDANNLHSYEEGTFTPKLGGSNIGTYYISGTGKYTRIGRTVHCEFKFTNQDLDNSASGQMRITGWPFGIELGSARPHCGSLMSNNAIFPHSTDVTSFVIYGETSAAMYGIRNNDDTGWTGWDVGNFHAGALYFEGTFTYMTTT